jgi:hypothetical protein
MKAEVPVEVSEALKLDDINWQGQRDLDFLLSLSPLEASKYIQKLCGLEAVPPILAALASMETETKKKAKDAEEEKSAVAAKVKAFEGFEKAEKLDNELSGMKDKAAKMEKLDADLSSQIHAIKEIAADLRKGKNLARMNELVNALKKLEAAKDGCTKNISNIEYLCFNAASCAKSLARFKNEKRIEELAGRVKELLQKRMGLPSLNELEWACCNLRECKRFEKAKQLLPAMSSAADGIRAVIAAKSELEAKENAVLDVVSLITWTRQDYRKISAELKEAEENLPRICPTCGRALEERK